MLIICNDFTIDDKDRISNRNFHSKLPIVVFQINSISLTELEEYRETSIMLMICSHFYMAISCEEIRITLQELQKIRTFTMLSHVSDLGFIMVVSEEIYFKAHTNNKYISHKNNTAQYILYLLEPTQIGIFQCI